MKLVSVTRPSPPRSGNSDEFQTVPSVRIFSLRGIRTPKPSRTAPTCLRVVSSRYHGHPGIGDSRKRARERRRNLGGQVRRDVGRSGDHHSHRVKRIRAAILREANLIAAGGAAIGLGERVHTRAQPRAFAELRGHGPRQHRHAVVKRAERRRTLPRALGRPRLHRPAQDASVTIVPTRQAKETPRAGSAFPDRPRTLRKRTARRDIPEFRVRISAARIARPILLPSAASSLRSASDATLQRVPTPSRELVSTACGDIGIFSRRPLRKHVPRQARVGLAQIDFQPQLADQIEYGIGALKALRPGFEEKAVLLRPCR